MVYAKFMLWNCPHVPLSFSGSMSFPVACKAPISQPEPRGTMHTI